MNLTILTKITLVISCLFLFSCAAPAPYFHLPVSEPSSAQKLVVFIDGTKNDESSYTNVSKLRNLLTLQKRTDIKSAYIEGVGTDNRWLGAAIGTGFTKDLEQAYEFLTQHYQSADNKVYLFGFSRGAYAVRALAGLINVAGIPDFSGLTNKQRETAAKAIVNEYKSKGTVKERQARFKEKQIEFYDVNQPFVEIEFVGIWDTVEALAIPDYEESNILKDKDYVDQLCNVKEVAHALSLDDDRANIFTPLLLTKNAAKTQCGSDITEQSPIQVIDQVFFSGAHSDVGGGYTNTNIDGVSLNWMLSKIEGKAPDGLVAKGTRVYADPYGKTHDPEAELSIGYAFKHRSISKYAALLDDHFTVHQSVIDRLACTYQQCNEIQWDAQDNLFRHCFTKTNGVYEFTPKAKKCYLIAKSEASYQTKACPLKKVDQGPAPAFTLTHPPACTGKKGEALPCIAHAVTVNPKNKHIKSGVILDSSQRYKFIVKTTDWNDHGLCATPESGRRVSRSDSSYFMKGILYVGKLISYAPTAGYMELIGEVKGNILRVGKLADEETIFSPKQTGELILRVNEPRVGKSFYDNNEGSAMLFILRVSE